MTPDEELNIEQENNQEKTGTEPDKGKYPHGVCEQSIGSWTNPYAEEQNVETPIGGTEEINQDE